MIPFKKVWEKVEGIELVQVHDVEMEALYNRCFEFTKPHIVEIGCAHGASTTVLAQSAQQLGGRVSCVDSFPENYYAQEKFGAYAEKAFRTNVLDKYAQVVTLHKMNSQVGDPISYIDGLVGGSIQVLFIDGDHSYEGVKNDCVRFLPYLQSGGYVAFHDHNNVEFSGVQRAAGESTNDWKVVDSVWDLVIKRKP